MASATLSKEHEKQKDNKKFVIANAKAKVLYQRKKKWFIIFISFLAVYDVIGDILYLSSVDLNSHTLLLNTYYFQGQPSGLSQGALISYMSCDSISQQFYCEPFDPEPKTYDTSSLWAKYDEDQMCMSTGIMTSHSYKSSKVS
eukprot:337437_1